MSSQGSGSGPVNKDMAGKQRPGTPANDRLSEAGSLYWQARELSASGDHDGAIRLLECAVNLDPTLYKAYLEKGKCHLRLGMFGEAIACFDTAVRLSHFQANHASCVIGQLEQNLVIWW
jgi:tetratricopeptide (TPR) repeat protein